MTTNNTNKKQHLTDEHKEKISLAKKGKTFTDEHKRKIGEAHKGKKWWHNNKTKTEIRAEICPAGFVEGRLSTGKMNWWNNGEIEMYTNNPPAGFAEGRKKKKWYNDGQTEIKTYLCPDGFGEGRLEKDKKSKEECYKPADLTPNPNDDPLLADLKAISLASVERAKQEGYTPPSLPPAVQSLIAVCEKIKLEYSHSLNGGTL